MTNTDTTWNTSSGTYNVPGNWSAGIPGPTQTGLFSFGTPTFVTITIPSADTTEQPGGWQVSGNVNFDVAGAVYFQNLGVDVTGGNVTITVANGGVVAFDGTSNGGTVNFNVQSGGAVSFYNSTLSAVTIGTLSGAGEVDLNGQSMTIAETGPSLFTGNILGDPGDTVVKDGPAALTLTGLVTVNYILVQGTLAINSLGAGGGNSITFNPSPGSAPPILAFGPAAVGGGNSIPDPIHYRGAGFIEVPVPFTPHTTVTYKFGELTVEGGGSQYVYVPHVSETEHKPWIALPGPTGSTEIAQVTPLVRNEDIRELLSGIVVETAGGNTVTGPGTFDTYVFRGNGGDHVRGQNGDTFYFLNPNISPPALPVTISHYDPLHQTIDLSGFSHYTVGHVPLVFIGNDGFVHYHRLHPDVYGMVRFDPHTDEAQISTGRHFLDTSIAVCNTILLLPAITNASGFDTRLRIADSGLFP